MKQALTSMCPKSEINVAVGLLGFHLQHFRAKFETLEIKLDTSKQMRCSEIKLSAFQIETSFLHVKLQAAGWSE